MPSDGPPWTPGQNCNLTLRHAAVNGNVAHGFYLKPDTFRVLLPKVWYPGSNSKTAPGVATPLVAGKRVLECVVVCRPSHIHVDGTPSQLTAAQWHDAISGYMSQVNSAITLVDPAGGTWSVAPEEMEDRLSPLGGQFLLEWETRTVFVEL